MGVFSFLDTAAGSACNHGMGELIANLVGVVVQALASLYEFIAGGRDKDKHLDKP